MPNPKNAYLSKRAAEDNALIEKAQAICCQYMLDTLQITINEELGLGYSSIMRLSEAWAANRAKYEATMIPNHPECDYVQEQMERRLRYIARNHPDKYIPRSERYPFLKPTHTTKRSRT